MIATAAHIPVWQMNTFLDGWFVLKALIAPDLAIVDLPVEASGGTDHGTEGELPQAWRRAIDAAQRTPEGRARIALAFTIGQWPAWAGHQLTPQPLPDDVAALQHSMYHTLFHNAENPGGEARIRKELAASGQQLSWNTGVDYREYFANGNESFKKAVRQLYAEARADLDADIARVNAFPRVTASPYTLEWWNRPGRTAKGTPRIPLLRLHEVGDQQVPISLVQGYGDLIRANGKDDLYRFAAVNSPAHCNYTRGRDVGGRRDHDAPAGHRSVGEHGARADERAGRVAQPERRTVHAPGSCRADEVQPHLGAGSGRANRTLSRLLERVRMERTGEAFRCGRNAGPGDHELVARHQVDPAGPHGRHRRQRVPHAALGIDVERLQ